MQSRIAVSCCVCAALWLTPAAAQQITDIHPANPDVVVPSPRHASVFDGFRPFREEKLAPWREVNDEVGRVGGQIGIFSSSHTGHGGERPVEKSLAPEARAPQMPPATHAPGHQEIKK